MWVVVVTIVGWWLWQQMTPEPSQVAVVPPTGETRAEILADYCASEGLKLEQSIAYADSTSDLPMLEAVGFLLLAALLLVANTIRLAAFARRKEIGIMRLVGASTLYIALPFLLEALVTAVVRVGRKFPANCAAKMLDVGRGPTADGRASVRASVPLHGPRCGCAPDRVRRPANN